MGRMVGPGGVSHPCGSSGNEGSRGGKRKNAPDILPKYMSWHGKEFSQLEETPAEALNDLELFIYLCHKV